MNYNKRFNGMFRRYIGLRFGRLVVMGYAGRNKHRKNLWLCRCDCGNLSFPTGTKINKGKTKSCGCLTIEAAKRMGSRMRPPKREGQELRDYWNQRNSIRRKANKVEILIRHRIWEALKKQGHTKNQKLRELLGTDIQGFRDHLESLFRSGMSWSNYGQWHVDHIIPCSLFDLSLEENQRKCFHFSNCQPLWAAENIGKGNRI